MFETLRATSRTIAEYLQERLDELSNSLGIGTLEVSLNNPEEVGETSGLSVWLYRVVRDEQLLNAPPERFAGREEKEPLPLRLHYLMTPVVPSQTDESAENEQLILGKVLQAFHDHSLFRGTDLAAEFTGTGSEFRVRLEPMSLEEITRVWDALERSYQLSVSYEVSVIEVCSGLESDLQPTVGDVLVDSGIIAGEEEPAP